MTEASTGSVAHCAGSGWVPVIRTSTRWAGALRSGVPASLHRVVLFTPSRGIEVAHRLARLTVTASTSIGLSGRLAAVGADRDDGRPSTLDFLEHFFSPRQFRATTPTATMPGSTRTMGRYSNPSAAPPGPWSVGAPCRVGRGAVDQLQGWRPPSRLTLNRAPLNPAAMSAGQKELVGRLYSALNTAL